MQATTEISGLPPEAGAVILPPLAFPELEPEGYNSCNTLNESKDQKRFHSFVGYKRSMKIELKSKR